MSRRIGIVLGGAAPAMTLMSGAMLGFLEQGVEFDVISTAGAGALIGLLALAPKNKEPKAALAELPNMFVSDLMYSLCPVNFKTFFKFGPFSHPIYDLRERLAKFSKFAVAPEDSSPIKRFFNDWIDLAFCALTPTTLEFGSKGLLSPSPQIRDLVDFDALKRSSRRFYLNAFDLDHKTLRIFDNQDADADAYHASEALPMLFAPHRVAGEGVLTTGATHDPTGLQAIWLHEKHKLDMVIALDPLSEAFWRAPANIWDAFQLMLMNPVIALEVLMYAFYAKTDHAAMARPGVALPKLYRVPIPIDRHYYPKMLEWSHSNAVKLQEIGRRAAIGFAKVLQSGNEAELEDHRFYRYAESHSRTKDFLDLLDPLFVESSRHERTPPRQPAEAGPANHTGQPAPTAQARDREDWWSRSSGVAVLASGGAPNLHLAAGALCAFYEKRISFDVVATSGAGALAGLLYAVPKTEGGQVEALRQTVDINVADAIYQILPMNYKVFSKVGPFSQLFWQLGQSIPGRNAKIEDPHWAAIKRLYFDSIDFMVAALTPTTLNYFSKSVCTRVGVIDDLIAWDRLHAYKKEFFLNVFDLNTQRLERFGKQHLTADRFWAALAMPWLFPPASVGGKTYTEGASHDPSALEALRPGDLRGVDKIIALDTVGPDLWTNPDNIYDALQLAIIDPIVALAENVLAVYGAFEFCINQAHPGTLPKLYRLPFRVPRWETPHILQWNRSNATTLWHVGYDEAVKFAAEMDDPLRLEAYRYYERVKDVPRIKNFLAVFDDLLRVPPA